MNNNLSKKICDSKNIVVVKILIMTEQAAYI